MVIKLIIFTIVLLLVSVYADKNEDKDWNDHKNRFGLNYTNDDDHTYAYNNFKSTDQIIKKHNNDKNQSYKLSHNKFSHWVKKCYKSIFLLFYFFTS